MVWVLLFGPTNDAGRPVERIKHQAHAPVKLGSDAARPPGKENLFHAFVRDGLD